MMIMVEEIKGEMVLMRGERRGFDFGGDERERGGGGRR